MRATIKEVWKELQNYEDKSPDKEFERFLRQKGSWFVVCCLFNIFDKLEKEHKIDLEEKC
jgi:hypothetical protein